MRGREPNADILNDRIDRRLKALGLSARAAALAAGLPAHTLQNIRRGRMPGADRLDRLATILRCTTAYLLGKSDKPDRTILEFKLLGPGSPADTAPLTGATLPSLLGQLDEIDRLSIRAIREFLLTLPSPPDRLRLLEAAAGTARQHLRVRLGGGR
jgi:transcriptional regulator with XRE-family HTH domain